jgi:hypothetical protein
MTIANNNGMIFFLITNFTYTKPLSLFRATSGTMPNILYKTPTGKSNVFTVFFPVSGYFIPPPRRARFFRTKTLDA